MVEPRGGRLLTFTGGLENLHGVRKVTAGTRYVIGMWFTCHEELEYHDDEEDERASSGGDAVLPPPSQPAPPVPPRRRGGGAGRAAAVPAEFAGALDAFAAAAGGVAQQAAPPVPPRRKKKAKGGASGGGGGGALADDATMEEAMAAYREALAAYDAIHGPPDALPPFVDDAAAEVDAERAWADFAASVGEAGPSGDGFDPWGGHLAGKSARAAPAGSRSCGVAAPTTTARRRRGRRRRAGVAAARGGGGGGGRGRCRRGRARRLRVPGDHRARVRRAELPVGRLADGRAVVLRVGGREIERFSEAASRQAKAACASSPHLALASPPGLSPPGLAAAAATQSARRRW